MKSLTLLATLSFLLVVANSTYSQTTYYVDNNVGNAADFQSLQTAVDSVNAGDVLMLQGSATSYGTVTINKRVTIIGPGYFLGQNPGTNTQASVVEAEIGSTTIRPAGEGTIISGCYISGYFSVQANSLAITRNRIRYINFQASTNNTLILQNYIYSQAGTQTAGIITNSTSPYYTNTNVFISNNLLSYGIYLRSDGNATICNNTIGISSTSSSVSVYNSDIYSNIIRGATNDFAQSNSVYNNVFTQTIPSDSTNYGVGNIWSANWDNLFLGLPATNSTDGQWQLSSGSPALGAGVGGTDCGAFGGSDPYRLSGIPAVPNIYELTVPSTGTINGGIEISVKVKANN